MKRWILFAVVGLGLSVLTSGVVRPEGAQAYIKDVHEQTAKYAMQLWPDDKILEVRQYAANIDAGARDEDDTDHVWNHTGWCVTITHFWDPDQGPDATMNTAVCNYFDPNAWQKARVLWGMALGEYHKGNKEVAYEYLGHVVHLIGDMSVPAHAHFDSHVYPDTYDDQYMNMGVQCDPPVDPGNECLSADELNGLIAAGPVRITNGTLLPLYWLFYTSAQIGGLYASDDDPGNSEDPLSLVTFGAFEDIEEFNDPSKVDGCDFTEEGSMCAAYMEIIRRNSYFHSIRAVAALYGLFEETVRQDAELTVVIDHVEQIGGHGALDDPDYYVRVGIGGYWFRNEGDQMETATTIDPEWAFGQNVGLTGTTTVEIELKDDDDPLTDDVSDIDPREDDRTLALTVDLAKCIAGEAGAVSGEIDGMCGVQMDSFGEEADNSHIWFHILAPNAPPTADAGPDQTVHEADPATLNGSFTDPNVDDTHTVLWHLESSTNGQAVPDSTSQSLSFTPIDDGVYTFSFTVTDSHGAQGSDTVVVTAENVPPVASIDSLTDETGAEIGVDVPVALVGLEVDLAGSFTDVGTVDTHTAEIIWGDGITDPDGDFNTFSDCLGGITGTLNATHIYAAPGIYTFTLNVTDDDGGVGTTTAQIEVVDAAGAIAAVVESLTPLADDPKIQAAIDKLQGAQDGRASNGALDKLEQGNPNAALEKIKQALGYLEAAEAADPSLDLTYDKGLLALAGKSVAVGAIAEAEAVAFKPADLLKIQQAKDLVAQGDALLAAHNYVGAVDMDQQAVRKVQNIH